MALVKGTNCGFVTVAPSADPSGDSDGSIDGRSRALKDTSPAGDNIVTEIGWWCDNATEVGDYDVAIYTHNVGDDNPEDAVQSIKADNAKGTTAGWKKVTGLSIPITAETIYWIGLALDNTATTTNTNYSAEGGEKADYQLGTPSLADPYGASGGTAEWLVSMYAKVAEAPTAGQDGPYVY